MDAFAKGGPGEVCHVETGIALVGGKWKLLLVRLLLFRGPSRFNALARELAISNKVLTENLRELEQDDIVVRATDAASGHTHYQLSPHGVDLMPILKALGDWAERRAPEAPLAHTPTRTEPKVQGEL